MVKNRPGAIAGGWAYASLLAAALCYFSLGHYDHNDHMYAVAPALAQRLRLYSDFAFVQTPLSVLIYSEIYKIVGAAQFYTALRLFSLGLHLTVVALGVALCWRHAARKMFASLLFASLYLSLRQADIIGAEIGNYTLSLALIAAALSVLDIFRGRAWMPLAVGILVGLAFSAKLSAIYMIAGFAAIYLVWERMPANPFLRMALYGTGVAAGSMPVLYYLSAHFDLFLFENIHFHYLSNLYRGIAPPMGLSSLAFFSSGSAVAALTLLFVGAALAWFAARSIARAWPASRAVAMPLTLIEKEILCVAAAAVIGAVTPGVVFQQYFAAPAFAIFLFAALYLERLFASGRFSPPWRDRIGPKVVALAMLLSVLRAYDLTAETIVKQRDGAYAISAVADMRGVLARAIAAIDRAHPGCHGDLVTAFGVPAIGAGANFSPISSTGPFAMRLDDIFAAKAPNYRWMSDPARYLTARSLIMSGFYFDSSYEPKSPFEKVMDRYAAGHGFATIALGRFMYRPIFLYVPPGCRVDRAA